MGQQQKTGQKQDSSSRNSEKGGMDRQEIARVAYSLYEKRGCVNGCDQADWFKAEAIVQQGGRRRSSL